MSSPKPFAKPSSLLDTRVVYCGPSAMPSVRSSAFRPSEDGLKPPLQTELGFMDHWYPIQVKQNDKVGTPDIRDFEGVMTTNHRTKGFFVSFDYSQDATDEIGRFFKQTGKVIVALTVKEVLDEQIAMKLA